MKRYIYCLKDPISKIIVYVGETANTEYRKNIHGWGVKADCKEKKDWLKVLKEKKLKPIFEIIDLAENKRDALEKEQKWIVYYLSKGCKLFNVKNTKTLKQYNENGVLIAEFFDTKEATEKTGIKNFHVARGLDKGFLFTYNGFDKTLFEKEKMCRKAKMKRVIQMDKEGNIIHEFEGVREAGRITGIDHRSISEIANGSNEKRHTAGGFKWVYK